MEAVDWEMSRMVQRGAHFISTIIFRICLVGARRAPRVPGQEAPWFVFNFMKMKLTSLIFFLVTPVFFIASTAWMDVLFPYISIHLIAGTGQNSQNYCPKNP